MRQRWLVVVLAIVTMLSILGVLITRSPLDAVFASLAILAGLSNLFPVSQRR
jgi:hypothetical protein